MNDIDIRKILAEELSNIAPEIDVEGVGPAADLREALDMDSMDFENFVTAVHQRLGIDIPGVDHPRLHTFNGALAYLTERLAEGAE